MTVKLKLLTTG